MASAEVAAGISTAHLVVVPLPITGSVDASVKRSIDQVVDQGRTDGGARPLVILEFQGPSGETGAGSEFERALSLARYLASDRLSGVRTVAYLPGNVHGHAVLPVLACEELVVAPDAEFGAAGLGETHVDALMRTSYAEIADRRRTVPAAVAIGMVDKDAAVSKVALIDGSTRFVLDDELKRLQESGGVSAVESIVAAGDLAKFTGRELRLDYGFASHLASDRNELLAALNLPPQALAANEAAAGEWRAIRVDVHGPVNAKNVNWVIRSAQRYIDSPGAAAANFLCVVIDSPGGSLADSQRLASFLADLDTRVRTVAYVEHEARADAALIAWACDQLVVRDDAVLGGPGSLEVGEREARELKTAVRALAKQRQRDWSLPVALIDGGLEVHRYTTDGGADVRYFSSEELAEQPDPTRWVRGEQLDLSHGLAGTQAVELKLARQTAGSFAEFRLAYHLAEDLERIEPTWAHQFIESLASPRIAALLLFVAVLSLIIEASTPGVGVPGFISGLCFLLFFWSNFLHGTAEWLEILLFVAGAAFLCIEIFILPGFGIFGIGGAAMMVTSLVLASQTFVLPRNSYEFGQFANSLLMVAGGLVGAFVSLMMVRKYLPDAPIFRRLMLAPPPDDELEERLERELLADYRHLVGKRGRTTTQLTPSGKARFGDDIVDVLSDGEVIAKNVDVVVLDVRGNRVLVQSLDAKV